MAPKRIKATTRRPLKIHKTIIYRESQQETQSFLKHQDIHYQPVPKVKTSTNKKTKTKTKAKTQNNCFSICFVFIGFAAYFVLMAVVLGSGMNRQASGQLGKMGARQGQGIGKGGKVQNSNLRAQLQQKQKERIKLVKLWEQKMKTISSQISLQQLQSAKKMMAAYAQQFSKLKFMYDQSTILGSSQLDMLYQQQREHYQNTYNISKYSQKPFCIVVPTYNNTANNRHIQNLHSILSQQYNNYKLHIIDDNSPDNTGQSLLNLIKNNHKYEQLYNKNIINVHVNKQRKMALQNILDISGRYCRDEDVLLIVDGDDYLLGKYVLKLFNAKFSDSDAWVVYSNFVSVDGKIGYSRPMPQQIIDNNMFRDVLFVTSHLRAFYTKLLHLIKKQDLHDKSGKYFHAANDVAILMPILQMSSSHIKYIGQINYYYNSVTGNNNHVEKKQEQIQNNNYVRNKKRYSKLDVLFQNGNMGS